MKVAFIIDPLQSLNIKKDTSYMMMLSVVKKGWQQYVFELKNLFVENGISYGIGHEIFPKKMKGNTTNKNWYELNICRKVRLSDFDVIFMRKDPPFNMEFIYATYILELAEIQGTLIVNKPRALRDSNEKFSIMSYPTLIPHTMVSRSFLHIKSFISRHHDVVVKTLDSMGGKSVFHIFANDPNKNVILETITKDELRFVMVQKYQPSIREGDKRILIINGKPIEKIVIRIPNEEDSRGNLACGASTLVRQITTKEYEIADIVGRDLRENGVFFAGIDIIGDCLTEINITSPTMAQQIYCESGLNVTDILMNVVENKILGTGK